MNTDSIYVLVPHPPIKDPKIRGAACRGCVFYGVSQNACHAPANMRYTNILTRRLDHKGCTAGTIWVVANQLPEDQIS